MHYAYRKEADEAKSFAGKFNLFYSLHYNRKARSSQMLAFMGAV